MVFKLKIDTTRQQEFIEITNQIEKLIKESKTKDGICVIHCPHTTAGLLINEDADPAVRKDILGQLEKLIPQNNNYLHLEGNSHAHIKSSLLSSNLTLIIENFNLVLGRWQGIYFCEFDGPREREVWVKTMQT
ncbi:MAG: secondary thiamine-phosphate synthase enzyme YjbQ [Candidatus Omnitrophica bacterium]|nr:secondary thiamine-phosphate synthase enzyme YjbQ [Candidatus Omnitrophota bacterium]